MSPSIFILVCIVKVEFLLISEIRRWKLFYLDIFGFESSVLSKGKREFLGVIEQNETKWCPKGLRSVQLFFTYCPGVITSESLVSRDSVSQIPMGINTACKIACVTNERLRPGTLSPKPLPLQNQYGKSAGRILLGW